MKVFSYSRLDKYCTCPRSFYLKYVAQVPEKTTASLALGKAVHAVIAIMAKTGILEENFVKNIAETIAEAHEADSKEIFNLCYQNIVLNEIREPAHIEEHFQIEIEKDIYFQGFIDLWRADSGRIVVLDWKTNFRSYLPTETYQLPMYAYYLHREHGLPVTGKLVFLREKRAHETEFTASDMEKSFIWVRDTAREIQQKIEMLNDAPDDLLFPACPSHLCEYCGYTEFCLNGRNDTCNDPQCFEHAVRLAEEIVMLETLLKEKKEKLYRYIEGTGIPVPVGEEKEFRLVGDGYYRLPPYAIKRIFEYVQSMGMDPFRFAYISSSNLAKLGLTPEQIIEFGGEWRAKKPALRLVRKDENSPD